MSNDKEWYPKIVFEVRKAIKILDKLEYPKNPVIVFDIDNTLINHSKELIVPIYIIYLYASMLGITLAIITGRKGTPKNIEKTKLELHNMSIRDIGFLYFRPVNKPDCRRFKQKARLNIHERGYNIIMSIGDQDSDIEGEHTGIKIKVPTPPSHFGDFSWISCFSTPSYTELLPQIEEDYYLVDKEESSFPF